MIPVVDIAFHDSVPASMRPEAMDAALASLRSHIRECGSVRPRGLCVALEGDEFESTMDVPDAEVVHLRRITGYLSNTKNWQASKKAELRDRTTHSKVSALCGA